MGSMDVKIHTPEREFLSVMSAEGDMWQLFVEGSKVKVLNGTPAQVRWEGGREGEGWDDRCWYSYCIYVGWSFTLDLAQ